MTTFGSDILAKDLIVQSKAWTLITVDEDTTVGEAITKLKQNNITSAPVIGNQGILGMVDMLDLLTFACGKMGFKNPDYSSSKRAVGEFLAKPVKNLINVSGRDKYIALPNTSTLQSIFQLLAKPNIHRVLIHNEEGELVGLLTQSTILRFLQQNKSKVSSLMNQKAKDVWPVGQKKVETIDFDKFVIDVLCTLVDKEISGIAVVNNEGQIVGNISASDLKRMSVDHPLQLCYDVYESIKTFMNITGDKNKPHNERLPKFDPIVVKTDDTVGQVVDTIVSKRIHRVYVVDENNRPVGEISLCDIIQKCIGVTSE